LKREVTMTFNMLDFIGEKKLGREHEPDQIAAFIKSLVKGEVPDYQTAAWLMAVRLNGMSESEATSLAKEMAYSGSTFDLSEFPNAADKHSTGGVGDKTTLIAAPLVASAGVPVVKFSGRALDFTGGTLDKLESIPGFKTSLPPAQIKKQAHDIGLVIAGASSDMVPADKILYSLRDVTSTVDSIPLIAASVMSKKIAGGAKNIVLDVKFGDGAFMKKYEDAFGLAKIMCSIGSQLGRNIRAVLSSMDAPLGRNVGNSLEIIEVVETLKGNGQFDLVELSLELASQMVMLATNQSDKTEVIAGLGKFLADGTALKKFEDLIKAQGGDVRIIDDYGLLPHSIYRYTFEAEKSGFISQMHAKDIGSLVRILGGGRFRKDDIIDPAVGVRIFKKPGDLVEKGERLVDVYYNNPTHKEIIEPDLSKSIAITENKPERKSLIRDL